jgi:uncharacterized phage protein gp47/JayE
MTLPVPKLDDRRFDQLVTAALERVRQTCPGWQDLNPGDPGLTLIEVFAFLTENMIYRLNRVPEKLYVTLMNLVGVQVRAPSAAAVVLSFSRSGADAGDVEIPLGTQVSTTDGSVTFVVTEAAVLKKGQASVTAPALHCEVVEAEPAALDAAQSLRVMKPPVIAPSGDGLDVIVGVEAQGEELADAPSRSFGGKSFAVWTPAASYAQAAVEPRSFIVDRASGLVVFPPRPPGATPVAGREVRVWYRRGGGRAGNVAAGALTVVKTPGLALNVTNPAPAAGGADAETVQAALRRTPIAASSMRAAVTARDFEREALSVGGVARARAFALAQVWRHADPGVVQILAAPDIDTTALPEGAITAEAVTSHRSEALRQRIAALLDAVRPLGVRVAVDWVKVRPVSVSARVVVTRGENTALKAQAIRTRLNALFSPFNPQAFGRALRASDAYEAILAEPGVRYADQLRFDIDEAPSAAVADLIADPHQPRTWFAATAQALHRSLDDGESWSVVYQAKDEQPLFVRRHRDRPGLLTLGVARPGGGAIHLSADCGETWTPAAAAFNCEISDAAWTIRDGAPLLLIATQQGLVQLQPGAGTGPAPVTVDSAVDAHGYYAVTASTSPSGAITVAVAARETAGVYLSAAGGVSGAFKPVGLKNKDIRTLTIQRFNARDFLWAAAEAEAGQVGDGAWRLELAPSGEAGGDWQDFNIGWQGGSCQALAFVGSKGFAASNRSGVLSIDLAATSPAWQAVRVDAGLPLHDRDRLLEVTAAIAAAPAEPNPIVFAGGPAGVYMSLDGAQRFALASAESFTDRIPLPPNWLYCAGAHAITVVEEEQG